MYELNLLFLLSSVSFVFSLGTVSLIKFLKTKKHWISLTQYIMLLSAISGLIGGNLFLMYNYLYENAELIVYGSLDSFIFIPVASYVMMTISLCYFTSCVSHMLKTASPTKVGPPKVNNIRNLNDIAGLQRTCWGRNGDSECDRDLMSRFWESRTETKIN